MWWVLLEALAAGLLLVFIVWWTMFDGRRRGERSPSPEADVPAATDAPGRDPGGRP